MSPDGSPEFATKRTARKTPAHKRSAQNVHMAQVMQRVACYRAYNAGVCSACRALYFLEPMLIEHGPGTFPDWCERLASDEPDVRLT